MSDLEKHEKDLRRIRGFGLNATEAEAFLIACQSYTPALKLLDDYDRHRIDNPRTDPVVRHVKRKIDRAGDSRDDVSVLSSIKPYCLTAAKAKALVRALKSEHGKASCFGNEIQPGTFTGIVDGVFQQTINGQDAYPSFWSKAAHLLYFVVCDHPFVDGNKRIASFLFCWLMDMEDTDIMPRTIGVQGILTVTLLVAVSRHEDKDLLIKLIERLVAESAD